MPAVAARAASTRLAVSAKQSSISLSSLSPSRTVSHSRNFDDLGDVGGSSSGSLNAGLPDAQTLRGDVKKLQARWP